MYEYLEHTADIKVRVISDSLEGLIFESIKAILDTMYEIDTVEPSEKETIEVEAEDPGELLYQIGNEVIAMLDEGYAITPLEVEVRYDKIWTLSVVLGKEQYSKEKHGFKTLVKAFTYNELKICLEGYERVAEFVLDIRCGSPEGGWFDFIWAQWT